MEIEYRQYASRTKQNYKTYYSTINKTLHIFFEPLNTSSFL